MNKAETPSSRGQEASRTWFFSSLDELLFLGMVLVVYLLILHVLAWLIGPGETLGTPLLIVPNAWLIGMSVVWLRRHPTVYVTLRGGRHAILMSVFSALLVAGAVVYSLGMEFPWTRFEPDDHLVQCLLLVLSVPIAEELFFRGLLLDHLVRNTSPFWGTILVSVLFGFLHFPQGPGLIVSMTLGSLILCYLALQTGSVLWPIALHMGWNLLVVMDKLSQEAGLVAAGFALALLGGLIVWGIRTRERTSVL